jgi:hypothetical protein
LFAYLCMAATLILLGVAVRTKGLRPYGEPGAG